MKNGEVEGDRLSCVFDFLRASHSLRVRRIERLKGLRFQIDSWGFGGKKRPIRKSAAKFFEESRTKWTPRLYLTPFQEQLAHLLESRLPHIDGVELLRGPQAGVELLRGSQAGVELLRGPQAGVEGSNTSNSGAEPFSGLELSAAQRSVLRVYLRVEELLWSALYSGERWLVLSEIKARYWRNYCRLLDENAFIFSLRLCPELYTWVDKKGKFTLILDTLRVAESRRKGLARRRNRYFLARLWEGMQGDFNFEEEVDEFKGDSAAQQVQGEDQQASAVELLRRPLASQKALAAHTVSGVKLLRGREATLDHSEGQEASAVALENHSDIGRLQKELGTEALGGGGGEGLTHDPSTLLRVFAFTRFLLLQRGIPTVRLEEATTLIASSRRKGVVLSEGEAKESIVELTKRVPLLINIKEARGEMFVSVDLLTPLANVQASL